LLSLSDCNKDLRAIVVGTDKSEVMLSADSKASSLPRLLRLTKRNLEDWANTNVKHLGGGEKRFSQTLLF
jgi:hypothetical protein